MEFADVAANGYTYLTLPPDRTLTSCIGLVVAGLAARARIGVAGLDEAVSLLEERHSIQGLTRYRFSLKEDGLVAEVKEAAGDKAENVASAGSAARWRTVVEMVS